MGVAGLGGVPAAWGQLDRDREKAERLCRYTKWNLHRSKQLDILTNELRKEVTDYFGPALDMATTAEKNWRLSVKLLSVDKNFMYINAAILVVLMILYVVLAWFCLFKKRQTINQAMADVYNVHFR